MSLQIFLLLVWCHFLADFILQSDDIAKNKSKSNLVLLKHVSLYAVTFMGFGILFAVINGAVHFAVDYFTSRLTGKLWQKGQVHNFFVVIGFDQALHITTLILTYALIADMEAKG